MRQGRAAKARRRKIVAPKRVASTGRTRGRGVSTASVKKQLVNRTHELREALEQQTATSEVLKVIGSSRTDVRPVFDAMVANAARLCHAEFSAVARLSNGLLHLEAMNNLSAEERETFHSLFPRPPARNFAMGRAVVDGRAVQFEDVLADLDYDARSREVLQRTLHYRTFMAVPIIRDSQPIGVIGCGRRVVKPFSAAQIGLVQTFADQAVIAIENARLFEEAQARTRDLTETLKYQTATGEVLNVISRSPTDVQPVFDMIAKSAAQLCDGQFCFVYRFDGQLLHFVAHHSLTPEVLEMNRRAYPAPPSRRSAAARAILERGFVQVPDINADPDYALGPMAVVGDYRSVVAVPILRDGLAIGSIAVARSQVGLLPDPQIELLKTFADQAVIAIENVRLFEAEQHRTRQLSETLEQQTATANVLRIISSSPGELQPVFQAVLENATRICEASFGTLYLRDADAFRAVAIHNGPPAYVEARKRDPVRPPPDSALGQVGKTREVAHIADIKAVKSYIEGDPYLVSAVELGGYRTIAAIPMLKDDELIGAITLCRQEVRLFSEKQIELVQNFAAQAVIAIENSRLLNELRQRTTDLSELLEQQTATSEVLKVISSSSGDLQQVFHAVLENATQLCAAKFGNLYLCEIDAFRLIAMHNVPPAFAEARGRNPLVHPEPGSALYRIRSTKRVACIPDVTLEKGFIERQPRFVSMVELGGFRAMLAVPMLKDRDLLGAIMIYRQETGYFTDKQIELVQNFAAQAVIAIENTRLLSELRELLEQQTATSKVLDVISRSAFDLAAVFETVAESSVRLCGADRAFIFRYDGELLRGVAAFNASPELKEFVEQNPLRPGRHSGAARAALERRTIHIPDVLTDPEYSYGAKDVDPVRTVLGVPILKGNDLLGVLMIYHLEVSPFTEKQIALVETFADQAAIAIENVRLLDELRERTGELGRSVGELRALGEVSQAVNSTLDLEIVLSTIVAKAVQLSGTEAGAIYVFDDQQREFRLRATHGMDQELIDALGHAHIGVDEPNIVLILAQREPIQVADLREEARTDVNEITLRAGFRARLVAPLIRGEDVVGLLVVRRRTPGEFARNTVDLLKTFAAQSVLAIQNARLFDSVESRTRELAKSLGTCTPPRIVLCRPRSSRLLVSSRPASPMRSRTR